MIRNCNSDRYIECMPDDERCPCEERCPQGQIGVYHLICYSADDRVIAIIEGPEAIIDAEGVPASVYMIYI